MYIQQFFVKGISHTSYLLGAKGKCAIIDPDRNIDMYLAAAKEMQIEITHILETHLHADFISGHMDLAKTTGAKIHVPASANSRFDHVSISEGDSIDIENIKIRVIETPGHTPEHISYLVTDTTRGDDPVGIFCGDTLFVGDVGRPDLFPGRGQELASKLYDSLFEKILKLPDFCEIYPAHSAGSLCGRAMSAKRTSTIGYERKNNPALQLTDRDEFIKSLTTDMPAAPDHFSRCSDINGVGPALLKDLPSLPALEPESFLETLNKENAIILDIRPYEAFGGGHIPGSWHLDIEGNFATFAGWVLPPDRKILLVVPGDDIAFSAKTWLGRVGLDNVIGYLKGGIYEWAKNGKPLDRVIQISIVELHETILQGDAVAIIDVRSVTEFEANHIEGVINIPVHDLRTEYKNLNKNTPLVLICNSGHRSSLGTSILKQHGFNDVSNVAGGMTAYSIAGYAPECPFCVAPHLPADVGAG